MAGRTEGAIQSGRKELRTPLSEMVLCEYFVGVGWGEAGREGQTLDALAVPARPPASDFAFVSAVAPSLARSGRGRESPGVS